MLKKQEVKLYLGTVVLIELLGALGAFVIRDGIAEYGMGIRPVISPPAVLFPIVWTILYALMGIGLARILAVKKAWQKQSDSICFGYNYSLILCGAFSSLICRPMDLPLSGFSLCFC